MSRPPLIYVCSLTDSVAVASAAAYISGVLSGELLDLSAEVFSPQSVHAGAEAAIPALLEKVGSPAVATVVFAEIPPHAQGVAVDLHCACAAQLGAALVLVGSDDKEAAVVAARCRASRTVFAGVLHPDNSWTASADSAGSPAVVFQSRGVADVLRGLDEHTDLSIPGGREDLILAVALAIKSGHFPVPPAVHIEGHPAPQLVAMLRAAGARVHHVPQGQAHTPAAGDAIVADLRAAAAQAEQSRPMGPARFQHSLLQRARKAKSHIVLPEGTEPRIVRAASQILELGAASLTLLGDPGEIQRTAAKEGVDISGASLVDPATDQRRESYAEVYAQLRAKKGVTLGQAAEKMLDGSYFGTMMVHLGDADGMVSGAVHTTAHTIRPAFEIIKTAPGADVVSSVFFMCLKDRVLVFGDCAVNPNPSPEQLASIAVSSAHTAAVFGFDPKVALLSYSTGTSGSGPDVDAVAQATSLAQSKDLRLVVDGPLQFDAAIDATVGGHKAPDSPVAGQANVFIFPDLSAGNAAYKAVQRTAQAVAIGPVLQGLNKPVNDLSRGALVEDIVNTILITAIQAAEK